MPRRCRSARHASFTLAARELGSTKSVVSAQLRSLESKYGVRLVERTTRSVRLTNVGVAAFTATERMLDEARLVDEAVSAHRHEPTGRVRVGVPHGLGATVIAPVVAGLVRDHPRLSIEMVVDDNVQALVREELDMANPDRSSARLDLCDASGRIGGHSRSGSTNSGGSLFHPHGPYSTLATVHQRDRPRQREWR